VGKPVGILLFANAARLAGARTPPGVRLGDLLVVGVAASIGSTVALFFATATFAGSTALAETKMGGPAELCRGASGNRPRTRRRGGEPLANE
jgi:Na+/H+ antiporter NhaA